MRVDLVRWRVDLSARCTDCGEVWRFIGLPEVKDTEYVGVMDEGKTARLQMWPSSRPSSGNFLDEHQNTERAAQLIIRELMQLKDNQASHVIRVIETGFCLKCGRGRVLGCQCPKDEEMSWQLHSNLFVKEEPPEPPRDWDASRSWKKHWENCRRSERFTGLAPMSGDAWEKVAVMLMDTIEANMPLAPPVDGPEPT